jgi:L-ascorbate metabolism protein UlaG (beta-lactamase superfamily)
MEISWLGHSCFIIKGKENTVVTDPCPPSMGYPLVKPEADIVTLSHSHPGHSYIEGIANDPRQIKSPGEYEIGGIFISGIASFHDTKKGEIKGKNIIFVIELNGITLCHLGDLGHQLTPQLIEEIGGTDILFLPVGEVSTIPIDMAIEMVGQLNPHIVIPMHYKTDVSTANLQPVDNFLKKMGIREPQAKPSLLVTKSSLPDNTQAIILDYPRNL